MADKEIFPKIDVIPGLDKLRLFMHVIFDQCRHEGVSDHRFDHPFDKELYDNQTDALHNMNQVYFPEPEDDRVL